MPYVLGECGRLGIWVLWFMDDRLLSCLQRHVHIMAVVCLRIYCYLSSIPLKPPSLSPKKVFPSSAPHAPHAPEKLGLGVKDRLFWKWFGWYIPFWSVLILNLTSLLLVLLSTSVISYLVLHVSSLINLYWSYCIQQLY